MDVKKPVAKLNREKYLNSLLYFIAECGNEKLGITKLNKLFYYLDFISYRDRNKNITGEVYLHLPMGPVASSLQEDIIKFASKEKLIEHQEDDSEKFGKRNRFAVLKAPDLSVFDEYEKNLLHNLCLTFKDWGTDQMIAQTHTEAPWVFSKQSKPLNYDDADDIEFFSKEVLVSK